MYSYPFYRDYVLVTSISDASTLTRSSEVRTIFCGGCSYCWSVNAMPWHHWGMDAHDSCIYVVYRVSPESAKISFSLQTLSYSLCIAENDFIPRDNLTTLSDAFGDVPMNHGGNWCLLIIYQLCNWYTFATSNCPSPWRRLSLTTQMTIWPTALLCDLRIHVSVSWSKCWTACKGVYWAGGMGMWLVFYCPLNVFSAVEF